METTTIQAREPFVFYMTPGVVVRSLPLFGAAFFLSMELYLMWGLAFEHLRPNPGMWWVPWSVTALLLGSSAFMIRLAFPPHRVQPRLEARHDRITFIPRGIDRVLGDPDAEIAISPKSSEVLICLDIYDKHFDGYRVIVHSPEEPEQATKIMILSALDARKRRKIADGIAAATGLPVRFVIRRRATGESVTESPWNPPDRAADRARVAQILAIGLTPFATGAVAGYLDLQKTAFIIAALAWLVQSLAIVCYSRIFLKRSGSSKSFRSTFASALPTVFTFGAWYGLAYVIARLIGSQVN